MEAHKTTVLAADDDPQLLRLLTRNLQLEGYEVVAVSDGQQALKEIERHSPDLVLLDVMMPQLNGFDVCQRVREFSSVPIIFVTVRRQDQDKVRGLDLGADDYLSKPFGIDELLARVRSVLRRAHFNGHDNSRALSEMITVGDLTVDCMRRQVTVAAREIELTPVEFRILVTLAQHVDRVVLQDYLLEAVWGKEYVGESHMLQVNINRLRSKLEPDPTHPRYIITRMGVGYLLTGLKEKSESNAAEELVCL